MNSSAKESYRIVALPGDGVGVEVTEISVGILEAFSQLLDIRFDVATIDCGGKYYHEHGVEWPDGSFERCQAADAILLGAVGYPVNGKTVFTKPGQPYPGVEMAGYAQVIGNRKRLNLYANVRPVKLYPSIRSRISGELKAVWDEAKVDYVIVRENTEDAYTGETWEEGDSRVTPMRISLGASERIVRFAFETARKRKKAGKVTCVDKSNAIGAHRYFREIFTRIGREEYADLECDYAYFDSFCMLQLAAPEKYDVVVAPNLAGDVISDVAALMQGGLGMAAGANIGDEHGMFEPIHGSAPDLSGKNRANPIASILATKMMLEWLSEKKGGVLAARIARCLEESVRETLAEKGPLTPDISDATGGGCRELGERIKQKAIQLI